MKVFSGNVSSSAPPPLDTKCMLTVCGGGGGVLNRLGVHILRDYYITYVARFINYTIV
jgi:hypothetical protein